MIEKSMLSDFTYNLSVYTHKLNDFEKEIKDAFYTSFKRSKVEISDFEIITAKHAYVLLTLSSNKVNYSFLNHFISELNVPLSKIFINTKNNNISIRIYLN